MNILDSQACWPETEKLHEKIKQACQHSVPTQGQTALLNSLQQINPDYQFERVLSRGGWYRPGGVIDQNGTRITDNLEEWIYSESDGSLQEFLYTYSESDLYVTRFQGQTHYLVSKTGTGAGDFLQLEVEVVQEVIDRHLLDYNNLPESLEDIIDPIDYTRIEAKEITGPRYLFRKISSISEVINKLHSLNEEKSKIERFMQAWDNSSASEYASFCEHWVLSLLEYTDAYGEEKISVKPISTYQGKLPEINQLPIPRGAKLSNLIHSFDRELAYPMAWFFYMLTDQSVSYHVAESIHKDLMGAYDYLPRRDLEILIDWYDNPYSL